MSDQPQLHHSDCRCTWCVSHYQTTLGVTPSNGAASQSTGHPSSTVPAPQTQDPADCGTHHNDVQIPLSTRSSSSLGLAQPAANVPATVGPNVTGTQPTAIASFAINPSSYQDSVSLLLHRHPAVPTFVQNRFEEQSDQADARDSDDDSDFTDEGEEIGCDFDDNNEEMAHNVYDSMMVKSTTLINLPFRPLEKDWIMSAGTNFWEPEANTGLSLLIRPHQVDEIEGQAIRSWEKVASFANSMIRDLDAEHVNGVFIPLRRAYLRFVCWQLYELTTKQMKGIFGEEEAYEIVKTGLIVWSSYCRVLELQFIRLWDRVQEFLRDYPLTYARYVESNPMAFFPAPYVLKGQLELFFGDNNNGLFQDYVSGQTGVQTIRARMQQDESLELIMDFLAQTPHGLDLFWEPFEYQPTWEPRDSNYHWHLLAMPRSTALPVETFKPLLENCPLNLGQFE